MTSESSAVSEFVVPPLLTPKDRYQATVTSREGGGWPKVVIEIVDTTDSRSVFTYERNYSMLKTFEPFRQLRDGVWHDYALISPRYTSFSVLDLESGEICAELQPTERMLKRAQESLDKYPREGVTAAGIAASAGFCPVDFYVPDWVDVHRWYEEDDDDPITPGSKYWDASYETPVGDFAVYSGCVWGDDTYYKVRYIDLSRISEGVVTEDARFGYVELNRNSSLRDAVQYESEGDMLEIAVNLAFKRVSGQAGPWSQRSINWATDDQAWCRPTVYSEPD